MMHGKPPTVTAPPLRKSKPMMVSGDPPSVDACTGLIETIVGFGTVMVRLNGTAREAGTSAAGPERDCAYTDTKYEPIAGFGMRTVKSSGPKLVAALSWLPV